MTAQDLKNSILQRAMQGKLVEQRAEEGTAKELIEQIRIEKESLIKEGKVRKEKFLPKIEDEEIPFEIPESWEWVRLETAFAVEMGQSPDGNSVSESANGMEFHQGKVFFSEKIIKHSNQTTSAPTKIAESNSVLLCVRAPVGKVNITDRKLCIGRGLCAIKPLAGMTVEFAFYLLETYEKIFVKKATGTTFVAITTEVVKRQLVPIPPLAEQKRIVAKIEELLPYIEKYDNAYSKLTVFNKKLPEDMQKSILQYAMQGKLVEQRAEEGTGEGLYCQIQIEKEKLIQSGIIKREKPLPEIAEEEKPFDIPASWKWVRLAEICEKKPVNGYSPKNVDYTTEVKKLTLTATTSGYFKPDAFKYVDIEKDKVSSYWLKHNDLLIQRSNSRELVGTSCIYTGNDDEYIYPDLMMRIRTLQGVELAYLDYALKSPATRCYFSQNAMGTSSSMPKINQDIVANTLIPLPPLQEQRRIVNKLENIIPYIEKIKKK